MCLLNVFIECIYSRKGTTVTVQSPLIVAHSNACCTPPPLLLFTQMVSKDSLRAGTSFDTTFIHFGASHTEKYVKNIIVWEK